LLWDVSTLCAVAPPAGLYGVVGTGLLWDVSTLCAVAPPAGLYGVVGTGLLWDVSTLCARQLGGGGLPSGTPKALGSESRRRICARERNTSVLDSNWGCVGSPGVSHYRVLLPSYRCPGQPLEHTTALSARSSRCSAWLGVWMRRGGAHLVIRSLPPPIFTSSPYCSTPHTASRPCDAWSRPSS
jgi:hypothetical protein